MARPIVAGLLLLLGRQLAGEDGDEDDVVDAEHDLEDGQRQQCDPCLRIESHSMGIPPAGRACRERRRL